jgi:membrane-anchored mycosin MYCP
VIPVVRGVLVAVFAVVVLTAVGATPAAAADDYVKYYTVASKFQGKPESLTGIAGRLLGDGARAAEVFNLNSGRKQPDGNRLTDPNRLVAGWMLVLPWDAYGAGVQYGVLPAKSPRSAQIEPATKNQQSGNRSTGGTKQRGNAQSPTSAKKTKPPTPKPGSCATTAATSNRSDWASLRLAADQAWPQSRGKGQLVAIVDSGVDGSLPQLAGHVAVGTDIVGGSGRGDTDCLGSGTAMAGLIVAQPGQGSGITGMAPDATVMPVRITGKDGKARPADSAAGIEAAVSEGATVVALGSHVDLNTPEVAQAANEATEQGVAVVAAAALASVPVNAKAQVGKGVLRVGGIGVDGQAAADYRSGGVHVVAPGINVSSVGITGTGAVAGSGTDYAVAFVAGEAALIRSAYPDLSAEQVAHRIQVTSDKVRDAQPDGKYGWGLINPASSVTKVLPEEAPKSGKRTSVQLGGGPVQGRSALLVIVVLVAVAAAVLLVLRIRKMLLDGDEDENGDAETAVRGPLGPGSGDRHDPPPPPPVTPAVPAPDPANGGIETRPLISPIPAGVPASSARPAAAEGPVKGPAVGSAS